MDRPASRATEVSDVSAASASPLLLWLESFSADAQKTPTAPTARLRNEAFESLLNSLDANDSRRSDVGRAVTPADSVRRPDSRLPRIRHAFQRRARQALLLSCPPVDRAFADTRFVERILLDLERLRLVLGERMAKRQLAQKQGDLIGEAVPKATPRRFRHVDEDSAEQRYHRRLQASAREQLLRFGNGAPLDLTQARTLFKETAGLESKSRFTAAGLERGALKQLGLLGPQELVSLLDAGGGALGQHSRAQGRLDVNRPWADATAVTCRCKPPLEAPVDREANFGQPPPWQSRARVLTDKSGRISHRQQLREELRREAGPPSVTALHDTVTLAQVGKAVLDGDASVLELDKANVLWNGPNPSIIAPELQRVLGTGSCRFPLLFVAAFAGELRIWNYLTEQLALRGQLLPHLLEDVEGWHLPIIMCLAPPAKIQAKDSKRLLHSLLSFMGKEKFEQRLVTYCLLLPRHQHWEGDAAAQPFHLLLERGDIWPALIELLVARDGFPHTEEAGRMMLVGRILAERGFMKAFLDACAKGGDAVQPQSQAMAGLYLGLLKNSVPQVRCLSALQALLEHGLAPAAPLTPSADQWPLHAAARHNCLPVVQVLLVAKADPFARNVRHLTALDVAKNSRSWAAAAAIRRAPFKARGFHVQLVAEALARHVEELHASMVAADTEDVAEALLRHLDAQELPKDSVATDLVAEALAKMTAAMPVQRPRATQDEEITEESPGAANAALVANALAQMALAVPVQKPRATQDEEITEESPGAANTALVANALAQMALAVLGPKPDVPQDEEICGESPDRTSSDLVGDAVARMMMASPFPGSDGLQDDVSSGRSDVVHTDLVANMLARMVLASPDPKSDASDSLLHEEVSSGHSDAANTALIANVLARMVLAATPSPDPTVPEQEEVHPTHSRTASPVNLVANALAQMVLANGSAGCSMPATDGVLEDADREVATSAARALAGVVVAAHNATDLEEVEEMLSQLNL